MVTSQDSALFYLGEGCINHANLKYRKNEEQGKGLIVILSVASRENWVAKSYPQRISDRYLDSRQF
jgi:hypothetical protein